MRRIALRMSRAALGDKLGVSFQQVQKYENGTTRISAGKLQQLSQILDVSVPFFFEGAPTGQLPNLEGSEAPSPVYITDFLATHQGLALARTFMKMKNRSMRRAIVKMVIAIADNKERPRQATKQHRPRRAVTRR